MLVGGFLFWSFVLLLLLTRVSVGIRRVRRCCSPSLPNIEDIDTVSTGLPQVRLHVNLEILVAKMALRSQEHFNVLAGGVENRR